MNTDILKFVYLSHKGRINRAGYWVYSLPLAIFIIFIDINENNIGEYVFFFLLLPLIYPAIMINIKRCHDRGKSGFFSLLLAIPIISLWPMIELGFLKGNEGENKFGPESTILHDTFAEGLFSPSKLTKKGEYIHGAILFVILVAVILAVFLTANK